MCTCVFQFLSPCLEHSNRQVRESAVKLTVDLYNQVQIPLCVYVHVYASLIGDIHVHVTVVELCPMKWSGATSTRPISVYVHVHIMTIPVHVTPRMNYYTLVHVHVYALILGMYETE